jgi:hypothetical protein
MATLKDRLDEFKRTFESGAPPYNAPHEAIAAMDRATDEFKPSGIENAVLKVEDLGPDFSLFNQDHGQVNSMDLLSEGPLVISFLLVTLLHRWS